MACGAMCNSTTHTHKPCELEQPGHEGDHVHWFRCPGIA